MRKISDEELLEELRKRFEENRTALDDLKVLNDELKNLNKKLEDSEALKSHFLSNIRNEIINPFASIMGLARHIIALKPENIEKARYMAGLIHSEAFILDFQLNNIFAAAEVEAGINYPQISNVHIIQLIASVIESFNPLAEQKKIQIQLQNNSGKTNESEFTFKTDSQKIQIIVSNLISNAIFYSRENCPVTVKIGLCEKNLCISVADSGIGISEADQKVIFDRFKRLDSRIYTANSGHGLGLSIVKEYTELLGGNLNLKSKKDVGSEFTINIPEAQIDTDVFSSEGNEELF